MANLTVFKFQDATGAEQALARIKELQGRELLKLLDAAVVTWPAGTKGPKTRQLTDMKTAGALGGGFWGLLFGLLFFVPVLGLAVGAASGAIAGALTDVGIDDNFIKKVRSEVTPGTSALFLLTTDEVVERVVEELKSLKPQVISTNLPEQKEQELRAVFAA